MVDRTIDIFKKGGKVMPEIKGKFFMIKENQKHITNRDRGSMSMFLDNCVDEEIIEDHPLIVDTSQVVQEIKEKLNKDFYVVLNPQTHHRYARFPYISKEELAEKFDEVDEAVARMLFI
jgi:hypothetical protein